MVKLEENKLTAQKPVEKAPLPAKVYIPLSQHLGKACAPEVKPGDMVVSAQRIASVSAHVWAPVHASVSGKVIAIEDKPHPVLGKARAVVIESDGEDRTVSGPSRSQAEVDKLNPDQIRKIVLDAGIVGMGGASFPSHVKLTPPKPVTTFLVNGAECEPFITGDNRLMVEKTGEIILAVRAIARCLGVSDIRIAIEENKPEAIAAFRAKADFKVEVLKSGYPQGGEKQLIRNVLRKEVPSGKLPFDIGMVVHNVATVYAIYEALYLNKPLYERVVTVTGSCLENPKNLLVRIGTPVRELIDYCGPLNEEPARMIIGGPMMGIAQFTDEVPVVKSSGAVLLLTKDEAPELEEEFCIRCGACVRACPAELMPCLINLASNKGKWEEAKHYGAMDCIECGCCNFVCPANRRMVQSIKLAKLKLSNK